MQQRPVKLSREEIKRQIWALNPTDRTALLTLSIIDSKKDEVSLAVLGLAEAVVRMTPYLRAEKRYLLAEKLRNAADRCDGGRPPEDKPMMIGGG